MTSASSFPEPWTGWWIAGDGKAVLITRARGRVYVTVSPARDAEPYSSAELLGGGTKRIEREPASCFVDEKGRRYLEIEAGTLHVGPTYRLYPAIESSQGSPFGKGEYRRYRVAPVSTPVAEIVLLSETAMGLYDDYDDDLGVPWALPLAPLRYAGTSSVALDRP